LVNGDSRRRGAAPGPAGLSLARVLSESRSRFSGMRGLERRQLKRARFSA